MSVHRAKEDLSSSKLKVLSEIVMEYMKARRVGRSFTPYKLPTRSLCKQRSAQRFYLYPLVLINPFGGECRFHSCVRPPTSQSSCPKRQLPVQKRRHRMSREKKAKERGQQTEAPACRFPLKNRFLITSTLALSSVVTFWVNAKNAFP